ncbi:MAG: TRAP transporter small permease [Halodesulfovibrio sp.]
MIKRTLITFLDNFEKYICQILLVFFVVILFMQIVLRAINMSLFWTEEIARYAFLWFILFGACYATRLSALNRVTMQFIKLPKWVKDASLLLSDIVWICFCFAMAWHGYKAVMDLVEFPYHTPALDWDLSKIYLVFPISFLLMAVRIIQVNVIKFVLKEDVADPDAEAIKESQKTLVADDDEGGLT